MVTEIEIRINSDDNETRDFVEILKKATEYAKLIPEAEVIISYNRTTLASLMWDIDLHDWDDYEFMIGSIAYTFYKKDIEKFSQGQIDLYEVYRQLHSYEKL